MTQRRRKPQSLPPPPVVRAQLADMARRVVDLERQLAEARTRDAVRRAAMRRLELRNQDLAARVPVDVARARRTLERQSRESTQ